MTPRQYETLTFIREYWSSKGYAPSYEDIMVALGAKSKSSVSALVTKLERQGYITREPHLARSIRVVDAPQQSPVVVPTALVEPPLDYHTDKITSVVDEPTTLPPQPRETAVVNPWEA